MESITDMIKALEFVNKQMMEYPRASSDKVLMFIIKVNDFDGLDGVISELAGQVCEHQYWMAAVPILVAVLFVVIKILLDRREVKKLEEDTGKLDREGFIQGMASGRV